MHGQGARRQYLGVAVMTVLVAGTALFSACGGDLEDGASNLDEAWKKDGGKGKGHKDASDDAPTSNDASDDAPTSNDASDDASDDAPTSNG
jgi:hypothetical protein